MRHGYLSEFFSGVAIKSLSAVEASLVRSHQHEFNGVEGLKKLFGHATGKQKFEAKFIYLSDHDDAPVVSEGFLTWYDAREAHLTRTEHRLYFPTTDVSDRAAEGDLLIIGHRQDGSVLVVIAEGDSTVANQLRWLFGFSDLVYSGFSVRSENESDQVRLEFASRVVLEEIGITTEEEAPSFLETMLGTFGHTFPATRAFSEFARGTLPDICPRENPDTVLLAWMEREELLFRTLERHIISDRLREGFSDDVDGFLAYSLSVQNRRKSRVGSALENHLEELFLRQEVRYDRTKITENKAKPDFIFPGINEYHLKTFPAARLTMLGVKTTCKDRWRQVLSEADRISEKHLLTLEPGISTAQTDEMRDKKLSLVLPSSLHPSYTLAQQEWLMSLADFISIVKERQ
jgi:hypothetical protein